MEFKEKLLTIITEEDEDVKLKLIEEVYDSYKEAESYKKKYTELEQKYIKTFLQGKEEKEEEEIDEEVAEESIDNLFKEEI